MQFVIRRLLAGTYLALWIRIMIVASTFVLALALYLIFFLSLHNGSILLLPTLLAAWLCGLRGMFLALLATTLGLLVAYCFGFATIVFTLPGILGVLLGFLALLVQGLVVHALRSYCSHVVTPLLAKNNSGCTTTLAMKADANHTSIVHSEKSPTTAIKASIDASLASMDLNNDEIFSHVDHELRTPLTTVYGYLQLLREYRDDLSQEHKKTLLDEAIQGCEELQVGIRKLLRAFTIKQEQLQLSLKTVRVFQVVWDICRSFHNTSHMTIVKIDDDILVQADERALEEIVYQLVENAYLYTPVGSEVTIKAVREGDLPDQKVLLTVSDNGPGIATEDMPLLFQRFSRLKSQAYGNVRGIGVGLYRAKLLAEAMGGSIEAVSSGIKGEGTCFSVALPADTSVPLDLHVDTLKAV